MQSQCSGRPTVQASAVDSRVRRHAGRAGDAHVEPLRPIGQMHSDCLGFQFEPAVQGIGDAAGGPPPATVRSQQL
eukprot:scaffold1112_cov116-Isochrysis_galbana.AAC.8